MDLREYRVQPDKDLYGKIAHRVRVRRMWRIGAVVAAVTVAIAGIGVAGNFMVTHEEPVAPTAGTVPVQTIAVHPQQLEAVVPVSGKTVSAVEKNHISAKEEVAQSPVAQVVEVAPTVVEKPVAPKEQPAVKAQPQRTMAPVRIETRTSAPAVKQELVVAPVAVPDIDLEGVEENRVEEPKAGDNGSSPTHVDNVFWVPNVIVPSGDVDENRTFKMKFTSSVSEFRIQIYNRGGRRVYESKDPNFVWNGTSGGNAVPQGAYVWVASFRDSAGTLHNERGTVTVIR